MGMNGRAEGKTRIDNDIFTFLCKTVNCCSIDEKEINGLLDVVRIKFQIDGICVFEGLVNDQGYECLYGSFSREEYSMVGQVFPVSQAVYQSTVEAYGEDGLSDKRLITALDTQMTSSLHYGYVRDNVMDGAVGFRIYGNHRWTPEERLALRRLAMAMKGIVTNDRMIKLEKEKKRLAEGQQRLVAETMDSISCGVLRYRTADHYILAVNQAALNILGYRSKEELQADHFAGVANTVVEEDKIKIFAKKAELRNIGDEGYVEYRVCRPDGSLRYVYGDIRRLVDAEGNEVFQRTLVDVTEQKSLELELFREQARRAMEAEAQKAEALASSNEQKAILLGLGKLFGRFCYANLVTDDCQFVFTDDDVRFKGKNAWSYDRTLRDFVERLVHKSDKELVYRVASRSYIREHLSPENPFYSYQCRRMSEGRYKWFRTYIILSSIRADGEVENIVVAIQDIDEEKERDERQKQALKEAYDAAMKANRAKSDFLSTMSHDIRTPMNGIIGITTIAESHLGEPEKMEECLGKIKVASHHLMDLINDVLDMSKIESGKVNLLESEFSMKELVDSLAMVLQPQMKEKEHHFTVNMHDIVHDYLKGDVTRLNQIFINILGNSIKYTERHGQISMELMELHSSSENYANYKIVITDNGIGMSREFLPHLFETFTQEEKSARSEYKGTGLGMAITHNLISMMGGSVEVESEEGYGTVFTVYLPLKIVDRDSEATKASDKKNTLETYAGYRFLLAEDNELNREVAAEILQARGALVETAVDGKEAVRLFAESERGYYDAILMDIQMPVMNGYEATQEIRRMQRKDADTIPIIALTANAFAEDAQRAKKAGMNAHISKPIDFAKLAAELKRLIKTE